MKFLLPGCVDTTEQDFRFYLESLRCASKKLCSHLQDKSPVSSLHPELELTAPLLLYLI